MTAFIIRTLCFFISANIALNFLKAEKRKVKKEFNFVSCDL